jgi:acyl-CoA thioesterase-2
MHGYFLRPGDANKPITFGVQRLRDGRSFSARRVHAYQDGTPILSMIASFQEEDEGIDHQSAFPDGIPDPESLPSTADLLGKFDHPVARHWAYERPFDIRHVDPPLYVSAKGEREARNAVWMKTFGPMPDDANTHRAALAYASDYTLLESILRKHGLSWITPGMSVVAPARTSRRMAAVRAGIAERPGCPRPCHRQDFQPGRPARRIRGPGRHGQGADGPKE